MAIHPIPPTGGVPDAAKVTVPESRAKKAAVDKAQPATDTEAAVFERSEAPAGSARTYTRDAATLSQIKAQVEQKFASLRSLVEELFTMQSLKTGEGKGLGYDQIMQKYDGNLKSFYQNLEVDDATRLKARQDISEDGFWGVKQASERAIQFAIALSGGDKSKLATLKDAIEKGYRNAERSWGGTLPDICQKTKEATLKGLDDWADGLR